MTLKDITDELKKRLQQGVQTVGNFIPPVQAYRAVQQMRTPQWQQQAQQAFRPPQNYVSPIANIRNPQPQNNIVSRFTNPYIQNRYVAPIKNIPNAFNQTFGQNKSLGERGTGALGLLGGVATLIPDPIQDVAFPAFDAFKGYQASYLRKEPLIQRLKSAKEAMTLEKPVGLGEALSTNPTVQTVGNLAELPLAFLAVGKLNKSQLGSLETFAKKAKTEKEFINTVTELTKNKKYAKFAEQIKRVDLGALFRKTKGIPQELPQTPPLSPTIKGVTRQAQTGVSPIVPKVNTKGQLMDNLENKTGALEQKILPKLQTELPKPNISLPAETSPKIIPLTKASTPEEVATSLPNRIDNFVKKTLGYTTEAPTGGVKEASGYTKLLRKGQEFITRKVEKGLVSENPAVRTAASTLQNFFRGLGMSPERATASMELRGEMAVANDRAFNVMDTLYKSLGNDKASLERINAVLDPSLAKTKVTFAQLTKTEQQVYKIIREGLDLVHDTSYANGHISKELWTANKNKYTPRLYDVMEVPPEVNKFVTQGKKMVNDLYKQRKGIDEWKIENNLNDPVYALGKRLAQVETNTAIKKYTDFLASNPRFVSDIERAGFTKLSDSPAYGALSGKWVMNSAAEDLKGFFFANEGMQNLYDVFRAYDRMGIRQLQKKLLTVFNPTTNVGNIVSDQVFGFVTGVDPLTLNKNLLELKQNPAKFKQLNDYLISKGINATDITRTDFVNKLGMIDDLATGKTAGKAKFVLNKIQSFYGGTDDAYKVTALKSLLDKGFTLEEATRKVADGFQNYANVGKFYDVFAKTPIVGKPFIKFQGDLIRIIKNGAVNNPLGLITFLGTLWGVARLSSKLSGETPEDRKTRENRFAAPMIPGLNIPLTWQTPMGEINVARYISPFFANNETTGIVSNMIPFVPNIQPNKDVASNIAMNANDPLVSPLVQLAVNRDFRGKPISDPKENKYQASTLTPYEKATNQIKFGGRAYLPPPVNSAIDVGAAVQGKPNMYGTPQTTGQAVARLGGIKISQYGPQEVQKLRENDAQFQQYANDSIDTQVNSVTKQQLKGEITPEQAKARIENLQKQKKDITLYGSGANTTAGEFAYLNTAGDLKKVQPIVDSTTQFYITDSVTGNKKFVDLSTPITYPTLTGNGTIDKKLISTYKSSITARNNDIIALYQDGQLTLDQAKSALDAVVKQTGGTGTKAKKLKGVTFKTTKYKSPTITLKKRALPKLATIKFAKPKVTKSTIRRYTIKA